MEVRGVGIGIVEGGGFFGQTRLNHAMYFLEITLKRGWIPSQVPIVDAGSGDGRMSALFDVYGFRPILNIELDNRLADVSREIIENLRKQKVVNGSIQTVQGNFTLTQPYQAAGISFGSVRVFYMGINSKPLVILAEKMQRESPKGTKLVVYGMFDEGYQPPKIPLRLERKLRTLDLMADFYVYST